MNAILRPALSMLVLMTLATGVAYPLAVTGVAQLAFAEQADGSLVRDAQGRVRGSQLIAQGFDGAQWFQPRPSAGAFATVSSSASNLSPGNPALASRIAADSARLKAQGSGDVPLALLTTSGSGLDPHLPPEAAYWQAKRVAAARQLPEGQVRSLIETNTERPLFGPPVVNVLALNRSLEAETTAANR
ncbi:potassium-transporting ATPase subunit KdpC [Pseudomonas sp. DTU_2021_1001937_2_SI_NGA_ILE_001]|uniref:potassium-transporting ATPase subunit KdpC n=1 Tax=Pseudomonas sp. DTU_2021_1001937_2_SI_NGA_ILE_001 TaxID=3077589 RepID=UPI0028FC2D04|nr:potassium-transporting ATPase subunit KdpC [Pseudomonas sp. DTU_2021_1001937_2_SI_NGA_ILE_001]WNW10748.1 potassium-transporting ATPase subunit KdpC [Pseudomonas sp. DTU_2021_1001937_2_SI_NGA_ILE_001]